jgi:hypothetical protein
MKIKRMPMACFRGADQDSKLPKSPSCFKLEARRVGMTGNVNRLKSREET